MIDVQTSQPPQGATGPAADRPDTSDYIAIHTSIRRAGHAIAAAADTLRPEDHHRMDAFVRYWRGHTGEILGHHGVEDTIFFPALRARVPEVSGVLDQLDEEHHLLDRLMEECREAIVRVNDGASPATATAVLRRLAEVMDGHLDLEDREVVPHFARCFSAEEYDAMTKQAMKQFGFGKQTAFTVPYVGYWATPEDREALFTGAPLPFRVLYRLTRTRHARLTALALGAASNPAVAA